MQCHCLILRRMRLVIYETEIEVKHCCFLFFDFTMKFSLNDIFIISILYLFFFKFLGNHMDGFENYWTTLMSLLGMIRGSFNFLPLLETDTIFTHCFFYSYYIFTYGLTIALIIAVLTDSYKTVKSQMFYKSTLDLQDYEMIDFMMKRFKLWAGFAKPKEVRINSGSNVKTKRGEN